MYYPDVHAGDVYNGSDGAFGAICSSGAHSHLGVFSKHAWGAQYEWHGEGPDCYYDYHVHGPGNPATVYASPPDGLWDRLTPVDAPASRQPIGFIGGGRANYTLWDNPLYGDH